MSEASQEAEEIALRTSRKQRMRRLQLLAAFIFFALVIARLSPAIMQILQGT
jgi:hypothetical protein